MARKVFISFLGTTNYVNCHYKFDDGTLSEPVRFVQEAIISKECREWSEKDVALIFTTRKDETTGVMGSLELNWQNDGHQKNFEPIESIGLQQRLEELKKRMGLRLQIEQVNIEAGHTEEEIWNIFDTVYSKLNSGDMIYFDVTHAFRSIPLFSLVLFNFSKFMLETEIQKIVYGAFEKLGVANEVRKMLVERRIAPVIDLSDIIRLQEYNLFASSLHDFGKVRDFSIAVGETSKNQVVGQLSRSIKKMGEYIETINIKELKKGNYIKEFRDSLKLVRKKVGLPKPIMQILDKLDKEIVRFKINSYDNVEVAIEWTIKHDMLMHSFPLAEEYIVFRIAEKLQSMLPIELSEKERRLFISSILGMNDKEFDSEEWRGNLSIYPNNTRRICKLNIIRLLRPDYSKLTSARNSLAHANGAFGYEQLKVSYIPHLKKCIDILNQEIEKVYSNSVFLNISNHPSEEWSDLQHDAASDYGEIIDMPFPSVPSDASSEDILMLANKYEKEIVDLAKYANVIVHIMGEMTFTYVMVQRLKSMGIRCVASTTERDVEEHDGKKTSEFRFVRFREY